MTLLVNVWLLALGTTPAPTRGAEAAARPRAPMPTDAQCQALGPVARPLPFSAGESLEYDVDALGAKAGTMVMRALPPGADGRLTVEVMVETNSFFSKVRQVKGTGTSTLDPRTLRPVRYLEDAVENGVRRVADVTFHAGHLATLAQTTQGTTSTTALHWGQDVTDVASAVYLLRSLRWRSGQAVCFDVYGVRRIWRVWGVVLPKEHASLPVGQFEAWHLAGQAARLDLPEARREVHLWVSTDARHLPLAALGTIDMGAVRATLKAFERPGEPGSRADNKGSLRW